MELAGKTIGVAMSGSFCTYENAFQELQKLVEAGAKVQTIFSEAAQTIDSRFGKAEEFVRRAEILTGRTPMLTIAGADWAQKSFGSFDCFAMYRKYDCKTCKWNHRYAGIDGGRGASSKRKTTAVIYIYQRCTWYEHEKYRSALECETRLFCAVWAG